MRIQFEKGNNLRTAETIIQRLFQQANNRFLYMESLDSKGINYQLLIEQRPEYY